MDLSTADAHELQGPFKVRLSSSCRDTSSQPLLTTIANLSSVQGGDNINSSTASSPVPSSHEEHITPPSDLSASALADLALYTPPHLPFSTFRDHLQRAINGAVHPVARRYAAVRCLLLSWEDDRLGCLKEIDELGKVFLEHFNFQVEKWQIPTLNSFMSLQWKLMEFQRQAVEKGELVILYYGGHGGQTKEGQALWHCSQLAEPHLRWHILQDVLGQFPSDMLFILDCCRAASAARTTAIGRKEMLAACGWENRTPVGISNQTSYTAALTRELKKFTSPFTVAQLHGALAREKALQPRALESTPFHCLLSEDDIQQIVFYPRREPQPEGSHPFLELPEDFPIPASPSDMASPLSNGSESGMEMSTATSTQAMSSSTTLGSMSPDYPKLLVSVHLSSLPNLRDFERWLTTHVPRAVSGMRIHVEGAFPSTSTLLVLSMPLVVWTLLPRHEDYKMLGFTTAPKLRSRTSTPRTQGWFEETVVAVIAAKRIVRKKRRRTMSMSSVE